MTNYITKIELIADSNIVIEPLETTTLITGFSGKGKTLLFKLIKYVLGETESIDLDEAKRQFPGLDRIQITFTNDYVFARMLNDNFLAEIKFNDSDEFIAQDKKSYREQIGALFGHEDIKVLRKGNPPTAISFTLSEYLNTLFFDESKLTDNKTLIEVEGRANEVKLTNYYKYFVTGKLLDESLIINAHTEQESDSVIKKALSYLNKSITKPSSEIKKEKTQLENKIKKNKEKICELEKNIQNVELEIKSQIISKNKLISLSDLYSSQRSEIEAASMLDEFIKGTEIICPNCGEAISWEPIVDSKDEINKISAQLDDIQKTIKSLDQTINSNRLKLNSYIDTTRQLKKENIDIEHRLLHIDKQIEEYITYEKFKAIANIKKQATKTSTQHLQEKQKELEEEFKTQVKILCQSISNRLVDWGFKTKTNVEFNFEKFDFTFNDTIRTLLPKGYRGFFTVAVIIELMLQMKRVGVPCFDFILVDIVWKVASFEKEDINDVVTKFLNNISNCGLQIIVFENENIGSANLNCKHITI